MGRNLRYTKEEALQAIKSCGGIVSAVAKNMRCDWYTAKAYIDRWECTRKAFENEKEAVLDMAESVLIKSIQGGNTKDAKWVLSTKGKNRGYSVRQELTGKDGEELKSDSTVILYLPENGRE